MPLAEDGVSRKPAHVTSTAPQFAGEVVRTPEWPHPVISSSARIPSGLLKGEFGLGAMLGDDSTVYIDANTPNLRNEAELLVAGVPLISPEQLAEFGLSSHMGHESDMGGTPLKVQGILPANNLHLPDFLRDEADQAFVFMKHDNYWGTDGPPIPLDIAKEMYDHPLGHDHIRANGYAGGVDPAEWSNYYDANGNALLVPDRARHALELIASGDPDKVKEGNAIIKGRRYVENPAGEATTAVMPYGYHIDTVEALGLFVSTLKKHGLVKEPVKTNQPEPFLSTNGHSLKLGQLVPDVRYALHFKNSNTVAVDDEGKPFVLRGHLSRSGEFTLQQQLISGFEASADRMYWPYQFSDDVRFMPIGAVDTFGPDLSKKLYPKTKYKIVRDSRGDFLVPEI
jgi:hypothetical protein